MRFYKQTLIDDEELSRYKNRIVRSGLFLLDKKDKPSGILKLKNPNKEPYKNSPVTIKEIDDLACRVMINKLARTIIEYKQESQESPKPPNLAKEIKGDFEADLTKLLHNYSIDKNQLEPQYRNFISKVNSSIKNLYKSRNSKPLTKKKREFYILINPLYTHLAKYLRNPITKELKVSQIDIFHYIAHLLIACGLKRKDPYRGHKPVFERIYRYAYREGHQKYMGRAKPFSYWGTHSKS